MRQTVAVKNKGPAPAVKQPSKAQATVHLPDASNHGQSATLSGNSEQQADQAADMGIQHD
jgi:hypothetical protein